MNPEYADAILYNHIADLPEEIATNLARLLRVLMVKSFFENEMLSETDSLDILNGNLTPDVPDTFYDDRFLLTLTREEIEKELGLD